MQMEEDDVTTVAKIVRRLDVVLFELGEIDGLWLETPRDVMNTSIIHEARQRTIELHDLADAYMRWVVDTRLEASTN